ncbi:hypothetical protein [Moritella sp. Urea-trap-13]|uniref:hypothetical protein n=1 Tax=Moritella sp. Urea-trap-13 TaxID=2058327 RepID=UPI000C31CFF7|nr:hypothetical protein [Moritella sp. Urea-trap-13]PKH06903.1 hypothetical protein CXF93_13530 [Moritella sp. Urea-trap-13]
MGNLSRLIIQGSAVLLLMTSIGCSEQGGSPSPSGSSSGVSPDVEPDPPLKLASTFDELVIEDGFKFDMQRTVNIDISFSQKQGFTEISIFSAIDPNSNMPINLLEKAELYNALKFSTSLPVPSYTGSMVVVINGDSYAELDLPIDDSNRIHYLVE